MKLQKANIDYRKVIAFLVMLVLLFVSYQAYQYKKSSSFQSLTIEIVKEDDQRSLLDKKEVMNMIRKELGFDPTASRIEDIDFWALETFLKSNPFVKDAQVYVDSKMRLYVKIYQRKPIARVKTKDTDYYVGMDGVRIPPSQVSTVRVPIVTGHINHLDVTEKNELKYYRKFVQLMDAINENDFLNALIDQIEIEATGEITFIPKLGNEKIIFGQLEGYEEKLSKLTDFYQYGNKEKGWNKYAYLDLSYKGQVVGGK